MDANEDWKKDITILKYNRQQRSPGVAVPTRYYAEGCEDGNK